MKVSKQWLEQLVDLKISIDELVELLPLRTIGTKEITDRFIELDMKGYNRADLLSMRGVALEVAAITDSPITFDQESSQVSWTEDLPKLNVTVENPELAPLYCLARIEGLKVGPSDPDWVTKLTDCGIRTVNNVADVTNLVMLEYGQPTHAFDAGNVAQETIVVRLAKNGEDLVTLDDKNRSLTSGDLLIADPEKPLGLAGVMGGKNSEITDQTTTILLEAAIFDPITLRKTGTRLGLTSEASKRFQHGLTRTRLLQALDAAIKMYQELGGKLTALSIVGDTTDTPRSVELSLTKTNNLIGITLSSQQIQEYLEKLHFGVEHLDQDRFLVHVPYFRLDIEIEEDLIEEVARMYGYEKIPAKELPGHPPAKIDQKKFEFIRGLKQTLVKAGLTEVQTYPYFSTTVITAFGWDKHPEVLVKLANPISAETEYLKQNGWQNLIEVVDKNMRQGYEDIAVFEINKVYSPVEGDRPEEHYTLSVALMNGTANPMAELYQILMKLDLPIVEKDREGLMVIDYLHPVRSLFFAHEGKQVGGVAEVHPRILDKFGISKRVAIAEIDLRPFLTPNTLP